MGTSARAVSGDGPIGAAGCRPKHTKASCQPPPPPQDQSDQRGNKRNLLLGKSGWAIFGPQTFGSQTPSSNTSFGGGVVAQA